MNEHQVEVTGALADEAAVKMIALQHARNACASGLKKGEGFIIGYASAITAVCGEGWVWMVGKDSAPVRAERKLFDRALGVEDGVENKPLKAKCNTYWKRVREAAGWSKLGEVSTVTTVDQKTLTELKTMLNRILNAESEDACPLASAAKNNLIDAFVMMGGDAMTLGATA